jgi:hypothetical protein
LNHVRNNFGSAGDPVLGDTLPFDGEVDVQDLNNVRNNFGAGPMSAVPEPSTWILCIFLVAITTGARSVSAWSA